MEKGTQLPKNYAQQQLDIAAKMAIH